MAVYYFTFHGDIETAPSPNYPSKEAALADLANEWGWSNVAYHDKFGIKHYKKHYIPDPEDDRVVLWEATADDKPKVVWHFSGWHWNPDASDLHGGPLDQGSFAGVSGVPQYLQKQALYTLAMEDY